MENDNASSMQSTLGLAVLLDLLVEKGVITEDEYLKAYEKAKQALIEETLKEIKKQF